MPSEDSPPSHELLKNKESSLVAAHQEIQQSYQFQGPIPPPSMLKEYEQVVPGVLEELSEWQRRTKAIIERWKKMTRVRNINCSLEGSYFPFW